MKQLNIGMVGYKFMGRAHANAYSRLGMFFDLPVKVNLKAVCGRDEEWLKANCVKLGFEEYETDWQKLIARDDIDIIDITTPSNFHKEIAVAAAKAGKHVFCEKPLALSLEDATEMLNAAKENNVVNQIGFNYRFAPAVILAKQLIEQGKLGEIFHFRGSYLQDWIIDPSFPFVWRLDKDVAGSGSHGDLGAHVIDIAHFLVGDIKTVAGMSKTFVKQRPVVERMEGLSGTASADAPMKEVRVDDATLFSCEFECGAMGLFEATRFATSHKNDMFFEINGSKGSVKFIFERMNELQYYSVDDEPGLQGYRLIQASEGIHPYMTHWWPTGHVIGYEHTFVHEMYEFINCIINKTAAKPSFDDGVKCQRVLEAVDKSIEEKRHVNV